MKPDQSILRSAEDLASDCDPVIARAAELAGLTLTPEAVGRLFPHQWPLE